MNKLFAVFMFSIHVFELEHVQTELHSAHVSPGGGITNSNGHFENFKSL